MELNAHACGSWRGKLFPNCREALVTAIRLGFTNIELDVSVTCDNKFVIGHNTPTLDISKLVETDYIKMGDAWSGTKMRLADVFDVLKQNPMINVVWDFRPGVYGDCDEQIRLFGEIIQKEGLCNSGLIEVYSWKDYESVANVGFKSIIFGLCGRGWVNGVHCTPQQLKSDMNECMSRKIQFVSAPEFVVRANPDFVANVHDWGGKIYSLGWKGHDGLREANKYGVDFATVDYAVPGGVLKNFVRVVVERIWHLFHEIRRRVSR